MSADKTEAPIATTQPDGTKIGGQTVTVKVPKLDLEQLNHGEWSSSMTDCLEDLPVCKYQLQPCFRRYLIER